MILFKLQFVLIICLIFFGGYLLFSFIKQIVNNLDKPKSASIGHTKPAQTPINTPVNHEVVTSEFIRHSPCLGTLYVGNKEIQTFDAGTISLYADGVKYIEYTINGYSNNPRVIGHVDWLLGEEVMRYDLHFDPNGKELLMQKLDQEIQKGTYKEDALHFKKVMKDIEIFNEYLANRFIICDYNSFKWNG